MRPPLILGGTSKITSRDNDDHMHTLTDGTLLRTYVAKDTEKGNTYYRPTETLVRLGSRTGGLVTEKNYCVLACDHTIACCPVEDVGDNDPKHDVPSENESLKNSTHSVLLCNTVGSRVTEETSCKTGK